MFRPDHSTTLHGTEAVALDGRLPLPPVLRTLGVLGSLGRDTEPETG